jgi:hypothetical protein
MIYVLNQTAQRSEDPHHCEIVLHKGRMWRGTVLFARGGDAPGDE